ncbi:hypothetical protein K490DRAFT_54990 [Saccharata proteae CBS 121410]|uniref:Uncharacterized protein n=1 Tax=Saccharata proteae CBS 121410 TaxID=1314787 RepID=A0A6A5YCE8_9PEZI|nr:hypothetical protein K490DRAFT_54990 [Saccharata proteae CBS 121410]
MDRHAEPMIRTASAETNFSQPTPDLQSPQGGFATHVERLEHHAERMSSSGSDIGYEIRKLQLEEKLSSRRSSLLSVQLPEASGSRPPPGTRSRNASTSSYSNSIVDVNHHARWGGYSPGGVTSPMGSIRSGSWSQASLARQRSASRMTDPSRLGQTEEMSEHGDGSEPATAHNTPQVNASKPHTRNASNFSLEYDKIVQDIQEELNSPIDMRQHSVSHSEPEPQTHTYSHTDLPDRPPTADTFQQAHDAFHDFDGVHYAPSVRGFSEGSRHSMLRSMPTSQLAGPPPPEGMVYYPAPVPRMLNLPKRLSQIPSQVQAKRRSQMLGSQPPEARNSALWLGGVPETADTEAKRKSVMSLAGLPPQLRASMYFDQPSIPQEVEVKGDSAEQALEDILAASARAPVNAFIDHPHAGNVRNEVYSKEAKRKSTATLINAAKNPESPTDEKKDKRKSRSSLNLLFGRRKSSTDELSQLSKRNSSGDKLGKLRKRSSKLSLGPPLEEQPGHKRQVSNVTDHSGIDEGTPLHEADDSLDPHHSYNEDEEEEPDFDLPPDEFPQQYGAPTTLLAELQMRKAQQRTRNRTAATAFPNGMHSTLLQLDAVAEVEKKRRMQQKINLAWEEEQAAEEDPDDDVPLGMLFPGRDGLVNNNTGKGPQNDWDRPLGLLEKKELEDNEPLSSRRNRLRGLAPSTHNLSRDPSPGKRSTVIGLTRASPAISVTPSPEPPHLDEHDDDEPLATRKERLRRSQMLDQALGDMSSRPISGDFASEMLSQFGGLKDTPNADAPTTIADASAGAATTHPPPAPTTPINEEDETLGQRRARLQAQALANNAQQQRPPLKPSYSMADILTAAPQRQQPTNDAFVASLPANSLLSRNEKIKARQRKQILEHNKRSTTYAGNPSIGGFGGRMMEGARVPSGGSMQSMQEERGLLGQVERTKSMAFLPGSGASLGVGTPMTMPVTGAGSGYFGQPGMTPTSMPGYPAAMSMGMGMMPGMPVPHQQPMMMPVQQPLLGMNGFVGYGGAGAAAAGMNPVMMGYGIGYPGMQMQGGGVAGQMGMGMGMVEQPLEPGRRDAIDRWRQGVL